MIIEPNTKTDFYYVNGEYIEYLKQAENESRGFTCVPNVHYRRTEKFVFGTVLLNMITEQEMNDLMFWRFSESTDWSLL